MQIGNYDGSSYGICSLRGSSVRLDTSGTERLRITSDGVWHVNSPDSASGGRLWASGSAMYVQSGNGRQTFKVSDAGSGVNRTWEITSDGNLKAPANNGINFSAYADGTSNPSSNLLDDYEEGTWTPSYVSTNGTFGYTTQNGWYCKVGNIVTVRAYIRTSSVSSTSHSLVKVAGLPFQVDGRTPGSIRCNGFQGTNWDDFPSAFSFENDQTFGELQRFDAGGNTDYTTSTMNNDTSVYIAGTYKVD